MDVTDSGSVKKAAEEVASTVDQLDVLVNNAGILQDKGANVLDTDPKVLQETLESNVVGPLQVTQAFWPLLEKGKSGKVINVSSGVSILSEMESFAPAYSISKTALNALTRQLAAAGKAKGIAVNSVTPGWVKTDMGGSAAPKSIEEGADSLVWLATEASQTLTGMFIQDRKVIEW